MSFRRITRRGFLHTSAAAVAAAVALPAILRSKSPNEKLDVAIIGVGGTRKRTTRCSPIQRKCRGDLRHRREKPRQGR